jgi:serine protease
VGAQHSCVISNGDVVCWGANYNGEQNIPAMPPVDILAVGEQSICAHSNVENQTSCWGWNGNGETQAPELINPKQIDAGAQHYCAIDDEGVKCWGWNGNQEATPPELIDPIFVDAGRYSSCAIDQGQVICWGLQARSTLPALSDPFDLAVGAYHSCALDEDGIKCWGWAPNAVAQAIITPPENLSNPVQIEAGDSYTCALHDGGVACWGDLPVTNLVPPESLFFDADDDTYSSQAFQDVFPEDSSEWLDTDGDDIGNNRDDDDDGDDVLDGNDAFPLDPAESLDTDADGVGNNADVDDDNDGVADVDDAFPLDETESQDTDGDGIGNNVDTDDDGDLVLDNEDAFPLDPAASADSDGDGYPDGWNSEASESEIAASGLVVDQMPNDPTEQIDTDGDGIGNNADDDDDGDGVSDNDDVDPLDPSVAGFFVSGRVMVDGEIILDSDTNNPRNSFVRNNIDGLATPDPATAQYLATPFTVHGYANKPFSGVDGSSYESGDEDDFFIVNALAGQRFTLLIGDYRLGDLDFYLFDQDLQIVAGSESAGPQESLTAPEDGVYYLNVYAWSGASSYTIETDFVDARENSSSMRFGEMIVTLKSQKDTPKTLQNNRFEALQARHELVANGAGSPGARLMRTRLSFAEMAKGWSHPKYAALNSRPLREASITKHVMKEILTYPFVESVQPNYIYVPTVITNDPLLPDMWHLDQIKAQEAWDTSAGAPSVIVAVIDTGVLSNHPDLLGRASSGYDFVSWSDNSDGDGIDPDPEDSMPAIDRCDGGTFYHGAHVAGTVGATGNNEEGIVGVAFDASLMHLRALDGSCGGTTYDISQAVLYAIGAENDSGTIPDNPADIINMSLGGGTADDYFESALEQAKARGVIVVAASGNSGNASVGYPASSNSVIAVGATGPQQTVASYSNRGTNLAIVAPGGGSGGGVWSLYKDSSDYSYIDGQGTSMASPHAAGVFALMRSVHPELTPARLDTLISFGLITDDIESSGFDTSSGWGLINAQKAVAVAVSDANGTLRLPARISLSASQLYLPSSVASAGLTVTNPGEVPLSITSIEIGSGDSEIPPGWVSVVGNSEVEATAEGFVGAWDINIDRSLLTPGFYVTSITFNGVDDEGLLLTSSLELRIKVSRGGEGDVGAVTVVLINADTLMPVWAETTNQESDYEFRLGAESANTYVISVSSNVANGEAYCASGDYCGSRVEVLTGPTSALSIGVARQ